MRLVFYCGRYRLSRGCRKLLCCRMLHLNQKWARPSIALDYHTPEAFTRCYWQKSEKVEVAWLVYRLTVAIYTIVTWTISYFSIGRKIILDKHFIYLTNWSYLLLTLECVGAAGIVLRRFVQERRKMYDTRVENPITPFGYKIYWIMYTISAPSAIIVSLVFWVFVYNPALHPMDTINISVHAINSIVVFVDFALVAHPYRCMHFVWTLLYVAIYTVFSIIYYAAGGTDVRNEPYIYKILDWRQPGMASATCAGVLFLILIVHLVFCSIHLGKKRIRGVLYKARAAHYATGEDNLAMDGKDKIATLHV